MIAKEGKKMKFVTLIISIGCILFGAKYIHESMNAEFVPSKPNKVHRFLQKTAEIIYTYEMDNNTKLREGDYWIKPILNSKHADKIRELILTMDLSPGIKKLNEAVLLGDPKDRSLITKVYDSWASPIHLRRKEGKTYIVSAGEDKDIETEADNISSLDTGTNTEMYPEPFMRGNKGVIGLVVCIGGGLLFLSSLVGFLSKK